VTPLYDTLIIGTGVSGLTAALRLVRKGHSVLLLESAAEIGGLLNPFVRNRCEFDVGVHYLGELGEGQSMRRLFDFLGLVDLQFREINPACVDRFTFADYETRLVKGIDRWGDVLVKDFPKEEANIRKFLELMKECRELNRVVEDGLHASDLPGMVRYGGDLLRLSRMSLAAITKRYFDDPLLRNVFSGPGADFGLPASRASALLTVNSLNHYLAGGYYPVGGSRAIRDAFVDALRAEGVDLLCNEAVTNITVLGEKRFQVRTANEARFEARSIISTVGARVTADMLDNRRPNFMARRKIDRLEPSLDAFCVFVSTDLNLADAGMTDANVWHYGTDDLEARYSDLQAGRIADQPSFMMSSPTLKDPESTRAPGGQSILQLVTTAPAQASQEMREQLVARLLEGAERYIPNLREHVSYSDHTTVARPAHAREQSVFGGMFTRVGMPGMYLAGSSVLGGGVMACMKSGVLAARAARVHLERDALGQLDDLSRAMSWVGRKAMLRTTPQKLHSNLHQLKRDRR